jgi:hypothetical protein
MSDRARQSRVPATLSSDLWASEHGEAGRLTDDLPEGLSRQFTSGSAVDIKAMVLQRLLRTGGSAGGGGAGSSSSTSGAISAQTGEPGRGLRAGSEMLRLKLSLRLSRRIWRLLEQSK